MVCMFSCFMIAIWLSIVVGFRMFRHHRYLAVVQGRTLHLLTYRVEGQSAVPPVGVLYLHRRMGRFRAFVVAR